MTLTRKRQTFLLILLTAATLMPAYSLQGWLASGHAAAELPFWFWIWETVAWSARALIEAGAILFLFETNAQTMSQERALLGFKVALIMLITLTLGPVVASAGLAKSIPEALPLPLFWLWSFAVASYAPLMLGSVGMAYRIQPHDTSSMPQDEPVASKPVLVSSPKPAMTQRRKEIVSSEPVASLPKAVASSEVVSSEPVASLPKTVASSEVVSSEIVASLPKAVASSEVVATPKPMLQVTLAQAIQALLHVASSYGATAEQKVKIEAELSRFDFPMGLNTLLINVKQVAKNNGVPEFLVGSLASQVESQLQKLNEYAETVSIKLWDELKMDEARWAYYQERKSMKLSDDTIAKELGVARITVSRLKETFNMVVTNGVHKE